MYPKMLFIALFCACNVLSAFSEGLFVHKIESYPRNGEDCQAVADHLAHAFSESAQVEIYAASSPRFTEKSCEIEIGYFASDELRVVRSVDDRSFSSEPYQGAYSSMERCERALDYEMDTLTQVTGTRVWLSYCYQESRIFSRGKYVAYVEGLGESEYQLVKNSQRIYLAPQGGWEAFGHGVLSSLKENPAVHPVTVNFGPGMTVAQRELRIRYYAKRRHWLLDTQIDIDSDGALCMRQLSEVKLAMKKSPRVPLIAYCGTQGRSDHKLVLIYLNDAILEYIGPKVSVDVKVFADSESCLEEKPGIVSFYQEKLKRPVVAGVCGRDPNRNGYFRVHLIEERSS